MESEKRRGKSELHIRGRKLVVEEKRFERKREKSIEGFRGYRWRAGKERERKPGRSTEAKKGQKEKR